MAGNDIERAVEIFAAHLADACVECDAEDLNDAAIVSAVFAGLVELMYRQLGDQVVPTLKRMVDELDQEGSFYLASGGDGPLAPLQ